MAVKKILISQNAPRVLTLYQGVAEKYGVEFEFRPFYTIQPLTSREFRAQRINLAEYTAIVFSSRVAIDAFFTLAEELRVKSHFPYGSICMAAGYRMSMKICT